MRSRTSSSAVSRGAGSRRTCASMMPPSTAANSAVARRSGLALRRRSPRSHMACRPSRIAVSHWSNPPARSPRHSGKGSASSPTSDPSGQPPSQFRWRYVSTTKSRQGSQPLHAVQPAERCQESVDAVGDDGSDQGFLVLEVVIHLRRANARRLLDVAETRAGDTVVVHQLRCCCYDPLPRGPSLGGEPLRLGDRFVRCHHFWPGLARSVAAGPAALIPLPLRLILSASPYKLHIGATVGLSYIQLSAKGLAAASGM